MKIREATIKDIEAIVKIGDEEFRVSDTTTGFWPEEILEDIIKSKNNPVLVAEKEEQIAGFIIANYNPAFEKAIIENIFVVREQRNKEVGTKLLSNLISELEKLNCKYICSIVDSDKNGVIKFYRKNSFDKGMRCTWLDKKLEDKFKSE